MQSWFSDSVLLDRQLTVCLMSSHVSSLSWLIKWELYHLLSSPLKLA